MNPIKIMVSIPTTLERSGWVNPWLAIALPAWASDPRFSLVFQLSDGFHTSQESRNHICRQFLDSDCEYVLMVDNDTKPLRHGRIVNLPEMALYRLPVVGAPIPILHQNRYWYLNAYERQPNREGEVYPRFRAMTPRELAAARVNGAAMPCDAVGTGAAMIRRDVIQMFVDGEEPPFLRPRHPDGLTKIGEDLWFCERARGYDSDKRSYCSLPHQCGHLHTYDYADMPWISIPNPTPEEINKRVAGEAAEPEWFSTTDYQQVFSDDRFVYAAPIDSALLTPYAITPEQVTFLKHVIAEDRPDTWIEFGAGISTLLAIWSARTVRSMRIYSVEQVDNYWNSVLCSSSPDGLFEQLVRRYTISSNPVLLMGWGHLGRSLVLVDGPSSETNMGPLADRHSAVESFARDARSGDVLILDDCHRPYERGIWERLQEAVGNWTNPWIVEFEQAGKAMGVWRKQSDEPVEFRYRRNDA